MQEEKNKKKRWESKRREVERRRKYSIGRWRSERCEKMEKG